MKRDNIVKCVGCGKLAIKYVDGEYYNWRGEIDSISKSDLERIWEKCCTDSYEITGKKYDKPKLPDKFTFDDIRERDREKIRVSEKLENEREILKKRYENFYGLPVKMSISEEEWYYFSICNKVTFTAIERYKSAPLIGVDSEMICPSCGGTIFVLEDEDFDVADAAASEKELQEIVVKLKSNSIEKREDVILEDVDIKKYLEILIDMQTNIIYYEEELKLLLKNKASVERALKNLDLDEENIIIRQKSEREVKKTINSLEKKLEKHFYSLGNEIGLEVPEKLEKIEMPIKPKAPRKPRIYKCELDEPVKPLLMTPGLFNRRKIEELNKQKEDAYFLEYKKYKEELDKINEKNEKAKNKYNEQKLEYDKNNEVYQQNLVKYEKYQLEIESISEKQNEFKSTVKKYIEDVISNPSESNNPNVVKIISEVENLYDEIQSLEKQIDDGKCGLNLKMKNEKYLENYLKYIFLDNQIQEVSEQLKKEYEIQEQLLSYNIIYEKYNDIVAWTSIYEYLDSERCYDLSGPDGAYNLYESEIRANIIISKLDTIISKLDEIKQNQFMLYGIMKEIKKAVFGLNEVVTDMLGELKQIKTGEDDAAKLLTEIKKSSAYIAYNSEKNLKYTQAIARTNKALLYMEALFG